MFQRPSVEWLWGFWVFWGFWSWGCFIVRHYRSRREFIRVIVNCHNCFFWYWHCMVMVVMMMVMITMVWMCTIISMASLIGTWVWRYRMCFICCVMSRWIWCVMSRWIRCWVWCYCVCSIWVSRRIGCCCMINFCWFGGGSIIFSFGQTSFLIYFWI